MKELSVFDLNIGFYATKAMIPRDEFSGIESSIHIKM